jgi:DNA-binding NarL/FixJ family response regulator
LIRPTVFLADDHPDFLNLETAFLKPHFELLGTASDGASLVSEVLRLHPDVVVADITMPIMTGIDAVHKLVQSGSTAKFVFLTIHSSKEYIDACLEEGPRIRYQIPNESSLDSRDLCGARWSALRCPAHFNMISRPVHSPQCA